MRSPSSDGRWDANAVSITATEDISLLSPTPRPKSDDYPVGTNARPPEPPLVFGSADAAQNIAALDDLFSRPQTLRDTSPPRQQGNHDTPNNAQSGGGGVPGGVSTPNTGAGGNGASSSGAGPAVTNANQFLSANLGMNGGALTHSTLASAAPTAPASPAAAPIEPHTGGHALFVPTSPPASPPTSPPPPPGAHHHPSPGDPLFVLDLNTGETLPANITLNTFSTWGESLLAQVSGAAVSSYSWSTTAAPDLTNITGATTANLQGTWASFTGAAHTDTITVTETAVGGAQLSQTTTFLVAGTDSPAYSASRPTSSSTWPGVVTPDRVVADQASLSAGPNASLGLDDGSVQTDFTMPSYNPAPSSHSVDHTPS